jgi:superfamily II DNA or RNA helicase
MAGDGMKLRPYQAQLLTDIRLAWNAGAQNVLAVAPTGSGKTVLFTEVLRQHEGCSVAIAHRQELVGQISIALARNNVRHRIAAPSSVIRNIVSVHMRLFGRSFYNPSAHCAVAGVDTLIRMDAEDAWFKQVTLGVQDEAHHMLKANKWGRGALMFPNAKWLGVTATPMRADGQGLGVDAQGIFHAMVQAPTMRDLIRMGYLTDYRIFARDVADLHLDDIPISAGGDFSLDPLRNAVHESHIVGNVVEHYLQLAPGKLGVTFAVDVQSAHDIADAFKAAGVPAAVVSADTRDSDRVAILEQFRRRDLLQLVNVDIFGEGFDLPAIEVVSMGRPTHSFPLFAQQFGRTLRVMVGDIYARNWDAYSDAERLISIANSTKPQAIIIDHVSNVYRLGLPDAPQYYTLAGQNRRERVIVPVKTCSECGASYIRAEVACPYCAFAPEPIERSSPRAVDGDLQELDPMILDALRREIDPAPRFPYGADAKVRGAIMKRHAERYEAQVELRKAMALWCGQRTQDQDGPALRKAIKEFYLTFNIDVLSAQALPRKDADQLTREIYRRMT